MGVAVLYDGGDPAPALPPSQCAHTPVDATSSLGVVGPRIGCQAVSLKTAGLWKYGYGGYDGQQDSAITHIQAMMYLLLALTDAG